MLLVAEMALLIWLVSLLLLFNRPLQRDSGMAENHGVLEAGQLPGSEIEFVERQRVAKDEVAQRVCS